jgi:hypothetical protein
MRTKQCLNSRPELCDTATAIQAADGLGDVLLGA